MESKFDLVKEWRDRVVKVEKEVIDLSMFFKDDKEILEKIMAADRSLFEAHNIISDRFSKLFKESKI